MGDIINFIARYQMVFNGRNIDVQDAYVWINFNFFRIPVRTAQLISRQAVFLKLLNQRIQVFAIVYFKAECNSCMLERVIPALYLIWIQSFAIFIFDRIPRMQDIININSFLIWNQRILPSAWNAVSAVKNQFDSSRIAIFCLKRYRVCPSHNIFIAVKFQTHAGIRNAHPVIKNPARTRLSIRPGFVENHNIVRLSFHLRDIGRLK